MGEGGGGGGRAAPWAGMGGGEDEDGDEFMLNLDDAGPRPPPAAAGASGGRGGKVRGWRARKAKAAGGGSRRLGGERGGQAAQRDRSRPPAHVRARMTKIMDAGPAGKPPREGASGKTGKRQREKAGGKGLQGGAFEVVPSGPGPDTAVGPGSSTSSSSSSGDGRAAGAPSSSSEGGGDDGSSEDEEIVNDRRLLGKVLARVKGSSMQHSPKDFAVPQARAGARDEGAAKPSGTGDGGGGSAETKRPQQQAPRLPVMPGASNLDQDGKAELYGAREDASWADLGVVPGIAEHLEACNWQSPTEVQQRAIPACLTQRDVLIKAPTGSGKTLAFSVPLVQALQARAPRLTRQDGTVAIIVTPTRELALQIYEVVQLILKRYFYIIPGMLIGGQNRGKEKSKLRKGISVVVATPGRLLDHLQQTQAFLCGKLSCLVLDEADRLLDMGFAPQLEEIIGILKERAMEVNSSKGWQTVLCSATLHSKLQDLTQMSLCDPIAIGFKLQASGVAVKLVDEDGRGAARADGAGQKEVLTIPAQLRQLYLQVDSEQRLATLLMLLDLKFREAAGKEEGCKAVLFVATCDAVEFYHSLIGLMKGKGKQFFTLATPVYKLHGNLTQDMRSDAFVSFAKAPSALLICTDVAARGLDFPRMSFIVQYDTPGHPEEYVHRIGRTARAGKRGSSFLFLQTSEIEYLDLLKRRGARLERFSIASKKHLASERGKHPSQSREAKLQVLMESVVEADPNCKSLASDAFRSFTKAYAATPSALKGIFHLKRLHLGKVASSFGLKEKPKHLGKSASKLAMKKRKWDEKGKAVQRSQKAKFLSSE